MNIFISFKQEDLERIEEYKKYLWALSPDIKISVLRQSRYWKKLAKNHLKKADLVVFFAGKNYSDNIDWEVDTAIKYGHKVYCVKLDGNAVLEETCLNDARLRRGESFDDLKYELKIEKPMDFEELIQMIGKSQADLSRKIFSADMQDPAILLEQYKLELSTSEAMIDRRQRLTTTYLTVFSILLPVITAMIALPQLYLRIGVLIISMTCIVLCFAWRSAILSYGRSNRAKFAILEEIEKKLAACIFSSEWAALQKVSAKYKSFTKRETVLPFFFILIYSLFAITDLVIIILECVGMI